jgi:cysteine desulfurase
MGRSREDADSTIRLSLGYATTEQDIERAAEAVVAGVQHVRTVLAATDAP